MWRGGASLAGDDLHGAGEISALHCVGVVLLEPLEVFSGAEARGSGKVPVAPDGGGFSVEAEEAEARAVGPDPPPLPVLQEDREAGGVHKVGDPGGVRADPARGDRHPEDPSCGEQKGEDPGPEAQVLGPAVVLARVPEAAGEDPLLVGQDPEALPVDGGLHPEGSGVDPTGEAPEVGPLLRLHPPERQGRAKQGREQAPESRDVPEDGVRGSGGFEVGVDPVLGRPDVAQKSPGLLESFLPPKQASFVGAEPCGEEKEQEASGDQKRSRKERPVP